MSVFNYLLEEALPYVKYIQIVSVQLASFAAHSTFLIKLVGLFSNFFKVFQGIFDGILGFVAPLLFFAFLVVLPDFTGFLIGGIIGWLSYANMALFCFIGIEDIGSPYSPKSDWQYTYVPIIIIWSICLLMLIFEIRKPRFEEITIDSKAYKTPLYQKIIMIVCIVISAVSFIVVFVKPSIIAMAYVALVFGLLAALMPLFQCFSKVDGRTNMLLIYTRLIIVPLSTYTYEMVIKNKPGRISLMVQIFPSILMNIIAGPVTYILYSKVLAKYLLSISKENDISWNDICENSSHCAISIIADYKENCIWYGTIDTFEAMIIPLISSVAPDYCPNLIVFNPCLCILLAFLHIFIQPDRKRENSFKKTFIYFEKAIFGFVSFGESISGPFSEAAELAISILSIILPFFVYAFMLIIGNRLFSSNLNKDGDEVEDEDENEKEESTEKLDQLESPIIPFCNRAASFMLSFFGSFVFRYSFMGIFV